MVNVDIAGTPTGYGHFRLRELPGLLCTDLRGRSQTIGARAITGGMLRRSWDVALTGL